MQTIILNDSVTAWPAQFQTHSLLRGLTPDQVEFLRKCMLFHRYQPGDEIVREDEVSDELYFITAGTVELLKYDEAKARQYPIGELTDGAAFGEIAFLNAAPRTCTIKALNDVEMLVLSRSTLEQQSAQGLPLLNQLEGNIAHQLAGTLQDRTSSYVLTLQAQLATLSDMYEFGKLFVVTIMGFCVAIIVTVVLNTYIRVTDQTSSLIFWVYLGLMLLPFAYIISQSQRPWRDFGVTWENWPKVTYQALGLSAILLAILSLGLWGYATLANRPFFSFFTFKEGLVAYLLYLPHSYLQEFIGRGVLQTSLQRFFRDKHNLRALFWSSLIFAMVHSYFGLAAMLFTFISGLLFGYIFLRQQNLIGVAIVHWLLGTWVFGINLM